MGALDWVRSKVEARPVEFRTIVPESIDETEKAGTKAGTWKVTRYYFKGVLPYAMAKKIRAEKAPLVNVAEGDSQISETLKIGGQYKSDFCKCEFFRTHYEFVETGSIVA